MNELALFAGAGGGILGGKILGWRTVCAVEWEQYPASVLCARQNDGLLPPFPIWDNVQTFDGKPWREIVDVVSGGFPCQDISAAGQGAGIDGERSGMWREMARIICEVRPKFVFVENSPMLTSRGLGRVLGDLASMGFDARWGVLGAADIGANHQRDRIWIVGKATNSNGNRLQKTTNKQQLESQGCNQLQIKQSRNTSKMAHTKELFSDGGNDNSRIIMERETKSQFGNNSGSKNVSNSYDQRLQGSEWLRDNKKKNSRWTESAHGTTSECNSTFGTEADWWHIEPNVGRVVDGVASRVDRLKAIGNGQVPLCAATAWRILNEN
jgi:DNA (cytosine-5)-methyltransferase 1